jgi:hypothetical protein
MEACEVRGLRVLGWLLAISALLFFANMLVLIPEQGDLSHPESAVIWGAWRVAHGLPLYEDFRQWPHRFMPYGPLHCCQIGWLARAIGATSFSMTLYILGRSASFLYLIGIGCVATSLARRSGCSWRCAAACGFGFLSLWYWLGAFAVSYRPDAAAVFWSFLAVRIVLIDPSRPRWRRVALACLLISTAYKPSLWAAAATVICVIASTTGLRTAARWGALYLLCMIVYAVAMQLATHGAFMLNMVTASSMGLGFDTYRILVRDMMRFSRYDAFSLDRVGQLIAVALWAAWAIRWRRKDQGASAVGVYFLLSLLVGLVSLLKLGSAINYLLEAFALVGVAAAFVCEKWQRAQRSRLPALAWAGRIVVLALVAVPVCVNVVKTAVRIVEHWQPWRETSPAINLMTLPSTALLCDYAFLHPAPEAHALSDPMPYVTLVNRGVISQQPLLERLARREFSTIAVSPVCRELFSNRASNGWIARAIEEHYHRVPASMDPELWKPNP